MIKRAARRIYRMLIKFPVLGKMLQKKVRMLRVGSTSQKETLIPTTIRIFSSNFMAIVDEPPLIIGIQAFLEESNEYLAKSKRIILLIADESFSYLKIANIMKEFSPIVSHTVVGNLFEIDRFLRAFQTDQEVMDILYGLED